MQLRFSYVPLLRDMRCLDGFYLLWSYFSTTLDRRAVIYTESWQKQLCFVEWSHWNPASVHYLLFFLISSDAHQHIFLISLQWGIFKKHHKFRHKITNNKIAKKYSKKYFSLPLNWIMKLPTRFNISVWPHPFHYQKARV